jgi:UDP-N-acetylglucosamine--N-acetylmuramyl-(pentapeptide) pyrophosphoryl-undecaprenol N-acetylglucosamine transferase
MSLPFISAGLSNLLLMGLLVGILINTQRTWGRAALPPGRGFDARGPGMSRFVISCGGTGGHVSPGISIAEGLEARGHEATLLISMKKVDARLVEKYPHLRFERMPGAAFPGIPLGWQGSPRRSSRRLGSASRSCAGSAPMVSSDSAGFTSAGAAMIAGR